MRNYCMYIIVTTNPAATAAATTQEHKGTETARQEEGREFCDTEKKKTLRYYET